MPAPAFPAVPAGPAPAIVPRGSVPSLDIQPVIAAAASARTLERQMPILQPRCMTAEVVARHDTSPQAASSLETLLRFSPWRRARTAFAERSRRE
jgi:hypothetical protein